MQQDALRKRQRIPGLYAMLARTGGSSISEMAERYGVSTKTIRRDLDDLLAAGAPLTSERGRWRLIGAYHTARLDLQMNEAVALFFALNCYKELPNPPMEAEVDKAMERLRPHLPPAVEQAIEASRNLYTVRFPTFRFSEEHQELFDTLEWALENNQGLCIRYFTPSRIGELERTIDPYALHFTNGYWYLIAYCHLRSEIRMFRVDRIMDLQEAGTTFVRPEDFAVEGFLQGTWAVMPGTPDHVIIDISPQARPWFERGQIHPSQRIEEGEKGWLRLHLDAPIETGELGAWILSYCGHAVVREPEKLREMIQHELARAVSLYGPIVPAPIPELSE